MAGMDAIMAVIRASRPQFRNAHDKMAFAVRAAFLASGHYLTATGPPFFSDNILSAPPSGEVCIEGWNQTEDCYGFMYTKKENTVLVKCLVMGDHLVIDALCSKDHDKEPLNLNINVNDYDGPNGSTNFADKYKDFAKLATSLNSSIVRKMEDSAVGIGGLESSEQSEAHSQEHEPLDPRFITYHQGFPGDHDYGLPGPVYPEFAHPYGTLDLPSYDPNRNPQIISWASS